VPFNPTDKFTIAFVQDVKTGVIERVMKGAPQVGGIWSMRLQPVAVPCLLLLLHPPPLIPT
jgi:hypothetical protein